MAREREARRAKEAGIRVVIRSSPVYQLLHAGAASIVSPAETTQGSS